MCDRVVQMAELVKLRLLKDWRVQCGISISSFTVSIVVVILVLTTHPSLSDATFKTVVEEEIAPIQFEPVCVDCAKLFKDPFSGHLNDPIFRKLQIQIRDGHRQCCINDTDQMAILVNMVSVII
ncbi:unnamed protein product [Lymnaea stagnalis]|uniref:Uncharacterized protein n=1 Tax=Lymnaea stagnalis TaxID=6523 RepID=A0AAV2I6J6_LYMST